MVIRFTKGTQGIFQQYEIPYDKAKHRFRLVRKILKPLIILSEWTRQMFLTYVRCVQQDCQDKIYSFASESVPDPWYTGDFEETYQRVQEGAKLG